MLKTLRDWIDGGTRTGPMGSPAASRTTFADQNAGRLDTLRPQLKEAMGVLAREQAAWDKLKDRADPDAHQQRAVIAPQIVDLQARVHLLSRDITEAEEAIRVNAALAEDYERRANDIEPWLVALLERQLTDDELSRAYRESRELDHLASELLRRTGDRQFRRPIVDPYRILREALADRVRVIDRLRLLRKSVVPLDTKAAS